MVNYFFVLLSFQNLQARFRGRCFRFFPIFEDVPRLAIQYSANIIKRLKPYTFCFSLILTNYRSCYYFPIDSISSRYSILVTGLGILLRKNHSSHTVSIKHINAMYQCVADG